MGYRALDKMREINMNLCGVASPAPIPPITSKNTHGQLEKNCLRFIQDDCEDLRFDPSKESLSDSDGDSIKQRIIPYNMEMDIDRLCLENAIRRFLSTGSSNDAFDVYFCYIDMFMGEYGQTRKMLELLVEFESNTSVLLKKHRDHYSHSVYVFLLGLALYHKNRVVRKAFCDFYGIEVGHNAAHLFLKYWGLTALFHDIGYPFELPFEQIKSYFSDDDSLVEEIVNEKGRTTKLFYGPYIIYQGLERYTDLEELEDITTDAKDILTGTNSNDIIASAIAHRLYKVYGGGLGEAEYATHLAKNVLLHRPTFANLTTKEDKYAEKYMDHAYFSALILLRHLAQSQSPDEWLNTYGLDALGAIALHNSLFKFTVNKSVKIPLDIETYPLAYLLMLCDELQCWDRRSYGQNSRRELHPMGCDFKFKKDSIRACYTYDKFFKREKDFKGGTYRKMVDASNPDLPSTTNSFVKEIGKIVRINASDVIQLEVDEKFKKKRPLRTKIYASESNFMHLYNFAVALHSQGAEKETPSVNSMTKSFDDLSLEYKLSVIMQAKAFAEFLDAIDCFYTDRPVVYELVDAFDEHQLDVIGPLEHERWVKEKEFMGWTPGDAYELPENLIAHGLHPDETRTLRDKMRMHKLITRRYDELPKYEKDKDTDPMNVMLRLIREFDGLRIYRR